MEFNPWRCKTSDCIIRDFFSQLADTVEEKLQIEIRSSIDAYAEALLKLETPANILNSISSIFIESSSHKAESLRKRIAETLKDNGVKICILIDDIDRLEGKEIFEVLRLIRNSAGFPNLFYVVTYDRSYLVDQLKTFGIFNANKYIEKIFDFEFALPKFRPTDLINMLENELESKIPEADISGIIRLLNANLEYPLDYLVNFRGVKRFAPQFSATYSLIKDSLPPDEFDINDLFLIELLHYVDHSIYDVLKFQPYKLIEWVPSSYGIDRASIRMLKKDDGEVFPASLLSVKPILDNLFGDGRQYGKRSLACRYNFNKYFAFNVTDSYIPYSVFNQWLESSDEPDVESKLNGWLANNRLGLLLVISHLEETTLNDAMFKRLINTELTLTMIFDSSTRYTQARDLFLSHYDKYYVAGRSEVVKRKLLEIISEANEIWQFNRIAIILNKLRTAKSNQEDKFKEIEILNMNRFISIFDPDPFDILDKNSTFSYIFNLSLRYEEFEEYDFMPYNPLIESLKNKYSSHKDNRGTEFKRRVDSGYYPEDDKYLLDHLEYEEFLTYLTNYFGGAEIYDEYVSAVFESNSPTPISEATVATS